MVAFVWDWLGRSAISFTYLPSLSLQFTFFFFNMGTYTMCQLTNLKRLDLCNNPFNHGIPGQILQLTKCKIAIYKYRNRKQCMVVDSMPTLQDMCKTQLLRLYNSEQLLLLRGLLPSELWEPLYHRHSEQQCAICGDLTWGNGFRFHSWVDQCDIVVYNMYCSPQCMNRMI